MERAVSKVETVRSRLPPASPKVTALLISVSASVLYSWLAASSAHLVPADQQPRAIREQYKKKVRQQREPTWYLSTTSQQRPGGGWAPHALKHHLGGAVQQGAVGKVRVACSRWMAGRK